MAYLKSFAVGVLALAVYLILIPAIWLTVPVLVEEFGAWIKSLTRPGPLRGYSFVGSSSLHVGSLWFLGLGLMIFAVSFFWEFRKLSRRA